MKTIVYLLLIFGLNSVVLAQKDFVNVNKPVLCGPIDVLLKGLADKDIDEKPVWTGRRDDLKTEFFVFVNFKTSAFTIIESGKEIGCIIGLGGTSHFFTPPTDKNSKIKAINN